MAAGYLLLVISRCMFVFIFLFLFFLFLFLLLFCALFIRVCSGIVLFWPPFGKGNIYSASAFFSHRSLRSFIFTATSFHCGGYYYFPSCFCFCFCFCRRCLMILPAHIFAPLKIKDKDKENRGKNIRRRILLFLAGQKIDAEMKNNIGPRIIL